MQRMSMKFIYKCLKIGRKVELDIYHLCWNAEFRAELMGSLRKNEMIPMTYWIHATSSKKARVIVTDPLAWGELQQ